MLHALSRRLVLLLAIVLTMACRSFPSPNLSSDVEGAAPVPDVAVKQETGEEDDVADVGANNETIVHAQEDLAGRLNTPIEQIDVMEVRAVTWPDASLGCAEPGMVYAQVAQAGLLVRLRAGGEMYFYHSGADQEPFLCEETSQIVPKVTPKTDEFVPPPGSEID